MIPIWKLMGRLGNRLFQCAYLYSQQKKGLIPDIYVQSEEYFENVKEEIKEIFGQGITPIDKVGIHVRRGDYVNNPFYVDLMATDYYQKAMALFPNEKFIVFSDDIVWCGDQDVFKNCQFSIQDDEIKDFNTLAGCKGIIMANSSYSYWCAYLNKGKVVAPKEWYSDGKERTKLLKEWILV